MRKYLLFFLSIMTLPMVAQVTIQGFVKEHPSGHTVPYATVSVLNTDSALVTGAITDDNGLFLPSGQRSVYIASQLCGL